MIKIIKKEQNYVMMQSVINAYVLNMLNNDEQLKSITETYFKYCYSPSFREQNENRSSQILCDYSNHVDVKLKDVIYGDLINYISKSAINRATKFNMVDKFIKQSVLKHLFNKDIEVKNFLK